MAICLVLRKQEVTGVVGDGERKAMGKWTEWR